MHRHVDIAIVGAGAAGLWAAAVAARSGSSTLVIEKTKRTGTKVLASGGTRCNLTTTLGARAAAELFGAEAAAFLAPAFEALSPSDVRDRFAAMGVPTKTEPALEKVFPQSDSARQVRDALESTARDNGAEFMFDQGVTEVTQTADGWSVQVPAGTVSCRKLLLCAGGKSYPKTGTTGDGYGWLRSLKLPVVDPVPALVPVLSPATWVTELTGVSLDAEARIGSFRRRRPTLFTHKGLSGPAPMDLSVHVSRASGPVVMHLDLLPDLSRDALRRLLIDAADRKGSPRLNTILPLQRRLVAMVCRRAGLTEDNPHAHHVRKKQRNQLVSMLKALPIPLTGTAGFRFAEVTAGGLALDALNRETMEVGGRPGLYVFGELLDLTGPIGGLNFQAAFATADLAARGAVAALNA
ncbi:MAG: putative Rossmann fold flavoprotein [Myxococcota bacterium]|jgi:predicted Rossmann fold flavoprotein